MEQASYENLKKFIEKVKNTGFWGWLFNWREIRSLSYDAYTEFENLGHIINQMRIEAGALDKEFSNLKVKFENEQNLKKGIQQQNDKLEAKFDGLNSEISRLKEENTKFHNNKERRDQEHENKMDRLTKWEEKLEKNEVASQVQRDKQVQEHLEKIKETWKRHQDDAQNIIKGICQRHQIEYLPGEKTPFRGRPDNTIVICGEYIIFDAKSPEGEDLSNFPGYIKTQSENAKKYAKQENVRKDVYFVIPANTSEVIKTRHYEFSDHTVRVISTDSLEPIILTLKKIEEYEFAEQLSPEERDHICRMLGKFIHATKRRIQVDQYFWYEFLGALSGVQALPADFLTKVQNFERSTMMNPPQERRAKEISIGDLKQSMKLLEQDAKGKGINVGEPDLALIETVPLYLDNQ